MVSGVCKNVDRGFLVAGSWRKLHIEAIFKCYVCYSLNITRILKLRRIRWAGDVAWTGGDDKYVRKYI